MTVMQGLSVASGITPRGNAKGIVLNRRMARRSRRWLPELERSPATKRRGLRQDGRVLRRIRHSRPATTGMYTMSIKLLLDIIRSRVLLILLTLAVTVARRGRASPLPEPKPTSASTSLVLNYDGRQPFESEPDDHAAARVELRRDPARHHSQPEGGVEGGGPAGTRSRAGLARRIRGVHRPQRMPIANWIAAQIMENVDVEQLPNSSRVVNCQLHGASAPRGGRSWRTRIAQAYIATALELTVEPARRNAAWFDEQLKTHAGPPRGIAVRA